MDNFFSGLFAAIIFMFFVIGLAFSIDAVPFFVIVFSVVTMLLVDLYQDNLGVIKKLFGKK